MSKEIYHRDDPPLVVYLVEKALQWVSRLLDSAAGSVPGGWSGLVAVFLVLILFAVAIRLRLGPVARSRERSRALFVDGERSAEEHRRDSENHALAGEWAEAIRERLRALATMLEDRAILRPRPGRTANEVAIEAGKELPAVADELVRAAAVFNEVWYGGRPAVPEGYQLIRDLDDRIRAQRGSLMRVPG